MSLASEDRGRAFVAAELGTLLNLRRALRNGTVWIDHSLVFRSRETLFIAPAQWQQNRRAHYRRLSLPADPAAFLDPLAERVSTEGTFVGRGPTPPGCLSVFSSPYSLTVECSPFEAKLTRGNFTCRTAGRVHKSWC